MCDLISVVIPIYNVEQYLNRCIDSILKQTYTNLEILLIDDCSTDSCGAICDHYSVKDGRIKVLHKKNGGLSDARNIGIAMASGEYITFVDSDDSVASDMIQYLYGLIMKYKVEVSMCQYQSINEEDEHIKTRVYNFDDFLIDSNEKIMESYFKHKFISSVAWGKLYKTKLFGDIRYPIGRFHEDEFTTYRVLSLCNKIVVGCERKYFYRQRGGSITNRPFCIKHMDGVFAAEERAQFIESNYKNLNYYAKGSIVGEANQCLLKIAKTNFDYDKTENIEIIKKLQTIYRQYLMDFLRCTNSCKSKIVALLGCLNVKATIKILKRMTK